MTQRLPNVNAPLVDPKTGLIKTPWNSFFQQFAAPPPAIQNVTVGASPFSITANDNGTMVITGGTVSSVVLTRGKISINMGSLRAIPISINDMLTVTYSVIPVMQFLPS